MLKAKGVKGPSKTEALVGLFLDNVGVKGFPEIPMSPSVISDNPLACRPERAGGLAPRISLTFGLGCFRVQNDSDMDKLELLLDKRGALVFHEICLLADKGLFAMPNQGRHRCTELSQVMIMPLSEGVPLLSERNEALQVIVVSGEENCLTSDGCRSWCEFTGIADLIRDLMRLTARQGRMELAANPSLTIRPRTEGSIAGWFRSAK